MFPNLLAAAMMQLAGSQHIYSALLYLDVCAAFASASAQLSIVFLIHDGDEEWTRFLAQCGFRPAVAKEIIDNTCRVGKLLGNGPSQHAAELMVELHASTWFSVESVSGVVHITKGTVAGHPCADIISTLADTEIDDELHRMLNSEDLVLPRCLLTMLLHGGVWVKKLQIASCWQ